MYSQDVDAKCIYCMFGEAMKLNKLEVICSFYGIVSYNHSCKKFKYDVFKKKIRKKVSIKTSYTADDFSID